MLAERGGREKRVVVVRQLRKEAGKPAEGTAWHQSN
jgi:hypothetical protein